MKSLSALIFTSAFHAFYNEYEALIEIETDEIL